MSDCGTGNIAVDLQRFGLRRSSATEVDFTIFNAFRIVTMYTNVGYVCIADL
jgi:hypothetical protein